MTQISMFFYDDNDDSLSPPSGKPTLCRAEEPDSDEPPKARKGEHLTKRGNCKNLIQIYK